MRVREIERKTERGRGEKERVSEQSEAGGCSQREIEVEVSSPGVTPDLVGSQ